MGRELLVVDLDHTLVKVDLLVEQILVVLRTRPLVLLRAIAALVRGGGDRAAFKEVIASAADVDAAYLPYRDSVLELVDSERRSGARVVLASASHRSVVERVSRHLGRFDHVIGSSDDNLKGYMKLQALRKAFPSTSFAYAGDSAADRPLWAECSRAIAVNPSLRLRRWLSSLRVPVLVLRDDVSPLRVLARQLRVYRWIRNLLVFVPLAAAPAIPVAAFRGALAFLALSCLSSAGYVLNDLADLQADRRHEAKKNRPLASGDLSVSAALALLAVLLLGAAIAAAFLPKGFAAALLAFFSVSVAYSFWLKRLLVVDVLALGALHTFRVVAGALAMHEEVSVWLLAFSVFLFFGLALIRRSVEMAHAAPPGDARVGGYGAEDQEALFGIGMVSSFLSVPALVLYLGSDTLRRLSASAPLLFLTAPLLGYWISRHLILAHRGEMGDDPFAYSIRDRVTWFVVALALGLILLGRV